MADKRQQYEEAKRVLAEIQHELDTQPLTKEQRAELEMHAYRLAGQMMSPWLPVSGGRRLIMLGIVLLGPTTALWVGNYEPFVWWFLLPFLSPRIVGECAYFVGVLGRVLHLR